MDNSDRVYNDNTLLQATLSGQIEDSNGIVIYQKGNSIPLVVNGSRQTVAKVGASTLNEPESAKVTSFITDLPKNQLKAIEISSKLKNEGVLIKNTVAMEAGNEGSYRIFYECVSKAGDPFFIKLNTNNSGELTMLNDSNRTQKMFSSSAVILPLNEPNVDDCMYDPICEANFDCSNGVTCQPRHIGPRNTNITLVKNFTDSDLETTLHYGNNAIAYPVIDYNIFIANVSEATKRISAKIAAIQQRAFKKNANIVENSTNLMASTNSIVSNLSAIYTNMASQVATNSEAANKLLDDYFAHRSEFTEEQKFKFNALRSRKVSFNQIADNLTKLAKNFEDEMKTIMMAKKRSIEINVKLWIQCVIRLGNIGDEEKWVLPVSIVQTKKDKLESFFAGDNVGLENMIREFGKSIEAFSLSLGVDANNVQDISGINSLLKIVENVGEVNVINSYKPDATGKSAISIIDNIRAVSFLYTLITKVSPMVMNKISDNADMKECPTGFTCLNYDKTNHVFSNNQTGNLAKLGITTDATPTPPNYNLDVIESFILNNID